MTEVYRMIDPGAAARSRAIAGAGGVTKLTPAQRLAKALKRPGRTYPTRTTLRGSHGRSTNF